MSVTTATIGLVLLMATTRTTCTSTTMATSTRRTTTTVQTASPCVASQHQKSDEKLLTDLFSAYYSARKNKRATYSQMRFEQNLSENLICLWDDIRERRYAPGRSMCFIIHDPVKREVFAASFRDRIVHHLLFNYLEPLFDPLFIDDSYSCRAGKGTHYGVRRMMEKMITCRTKNPNDPVYVLKLDIEGYFMKINKNILYERIVSVVEKSDLDFGLTDYLLRKIIFDDPKRGCRIRGSRSDWDGLPLSKSLFHSPEGCGLPIGNLTSQLFSNIYLSVFDDYVTKERNVEYYGRYVDDFYLIGPSKEKLLAEIPRMRQFLKNELALKLHPKKVYLQDITKGVRFLGYWVFPDSSSITRSSRHRMNTHIEKALTESIDPYQGNSIIRSCCSQKLIPDIR